ncbi:transcription intermediary factor 1-beta-like [Dreissena polymorpha]|uniref:transcription intermediary factor 1-beta-like n=1 Tax=Dreissena polymorpha TaxID=45954 RepID=UPI002264C871|nr:transcription intermediary factor 1-beta-like [Dreissena polymorpha]
MTANTTKNSISVPDEYLHVLCDPCRFSGKTTVAMKYCRDCNGHLCPNCVNTHIRVSNTKNHHMSYIINKKNNFVTTALTTTTADLVYGTAAQKALEAKCVDHGKPVVSFCALHDALCCRVCIGTGHRECKLQILSEAANGSRDGKEIRGIETVIKRLQARFEDIQRDKQTNLQHLGHQNDTFSGAIKTYRRTVNNVLDKLEQNLVKKQDRHFETKVEELRGCLKTCQSAISVLNGSLNKLDIATRQGDEQQLFMTIKKVQAITKRYEKIYADVDKLPRNYAFHFIPELSIEKFLKGVSELGKIKDESTTSNGLNAVPKTKGKRSPNDSGSDEKLMASVDLKSRQRSPRKTESPVKQLLKQPLGTDEFSVRYGCLSFDISF